MSAGEAYGPTTLTVADNERQNRAPVNRIPADSTGDEQIRVRLRTPGSSTAVNPYLDGGWWPQSLDLVAELPALITSAMSAGFDVHRVVYKMSTWHQAPRRMTSSSEHRVSLSAYRRQAANTIALIDGSGRRRLDLLVIPPDVEPAEAQRALDIAGTDGDRDSAGQVLDRAAR